MFGLTTFLELKIVANESSCIFLNYAVNYSVNLEYMMDEAEQAVVMSADEPMQ